MVPKITNRNCNKEKTRKTAIFFLLIALVLAGCAPAGQGGGAVQYPTEAINIMAPASAGGGWDGTARAMQAALAKDQARPSRSTTHPRRHR
jgi:putative tricarboxylic transport membrane protein